MNAAIALVLDRLEGVKPVGRGWIAHCPVPTHGRGHGDRRRSLAIAEGRDGRALLHCHAGDRLDEILGALGLTASNLFPAAGDDTSRTPRRVCSALDAARAAVLREAGRQPWARPYVLDLYGGARWVRARRQGIDRIRGMATAAGDAAADAWWDRLAEATNEERRMFVMEALLDELATLCRGLTDDDLLGLASISHTARRFSVEVF